MNVIQIIKVSNDIFFIILFSIFDINVISLHEENSNVHSMEEEIIADSDTPNSPFNFEGTILPLKIYGSLHYIL